RSDLFYRLNVFPIRVPPLRERAEDIPELVRHFVERSVRRLGRAAPAVSAAAIQAVQALDWPGSNPALQNEILSAGVLSKGGSLQLPEQARQTRVPLPSEGGAPQTLRDIERESILRALRESRGVIGGPSGAAARLGLKRTTLQSMMQKLGIKRPSY